jgi:hypothetical protein
LFQLSFERKTKGRLGRAKTQLPVYFCCKTSQDYSMGNGLFSGGIVLSRYRHELGNSVIFVSRCKPTKAKGTNKECVSNNHLKFIMLKPAFVNQILEMIERQPLTDCISLKIHLKTYNVFQCKCESYSAHLFFKQGMLCTKTDCDEIDTLSKTKPTMTKFPTVVARDTDVTVVQIYNTQLARK